MPCNELLLELVKVFGKLQVVPFKSVNVSSYFLVLSRVKIFDVVNLKGRLLQLSRVNQVAYVGEVLCYVRLEDLLLFFVPYLLACRSYQVSTREEGTFSAIAQVFSAGVFFLRALCIAQLNDFHNVFICTVFQEDLGCVFLYGIDFFVQNVA